jgi:hypothetical protein
MGVDLPHFLRGSDTATSQGGYKVPPCLPPLFIDDDDIPAGDEWIADRVRSYEDAACLGVTGRHIHNDEPVHGDSPLPALVTPTLLYDPILKMPLTQVQHDRRRNPVLAVHGTNASIRSRVYAALFLLLTLPLHTIASRLGGADAGATQH